MPGGASAQVLANPHRDASVCGSLRGPHAASRSGSERSPAAGSFPVSTAALRAGLAFASGGRGAKAGRLATRVLRARGVLAAVLPASPPRAQPRRGAEQLPEALRCLLPCQHGAKEPGEQSRLFLLQSRAAGRLGAAGERRRRRRRRTSPASERSFAKGRINKYWQERSIFAPCYHWNGTTA